MSLIDDIRKDAEAGTPGPWQVAEYPYCKHVVDFGISPPNDPYFAVRSGKGGGVCHSDGERCETLVNARRISRVPEMEAALLASDALASEAHAVIQNIDRLGDYVDEMVSMPLSVARDLSKALAAYRKATEAAK